jgi:hypothetical protein
MKSRLRQHPWIFSILLSLLLCSCGSKSPTVQLGYLKSGNYNIVPTAFIDYEPGTTIDAVLSPRISDVTVKRSYYNETITYPTGKKLEIEFFVTPGNPSKYEATVNGKEMEVPVYGDEYINNIAPQLKDKVGFSFVPNGFGKPLMQLLAPLCPNGAELNERYSSLPDREWITSLDSITIQCPATGKTQTIDISYERDLTVPESFITSFTVKIDETSTADQAEPTIRAETGGAALPSGPKAGHWEGTNPYVSFDVTDEGQVVNFMLNAPFVSTTCNIAIEQIPVDGSEFLVDAKTGDVEEASIGIFVIKGKFDGDTVTGTQKVEFCGRTVALYPEEQDWRASWASNRITLVTETTLPTSVVAKIIPTEPEPSPTPAPIPTDPEPSPTHEPVVVKPTYLAEYEPRDVMLGYGVYSVGKFKFSSEDPADDIHIGDPMVIQGVEYSHGIFAHAPSQIDFNLGDAHSFTELSLTIGMIDKISCGDGVNFSIWGDREELYTSEAIYPWSEPVAVQIPISGIGVLTFFVDEGRNGNRDCDWAIWGDPVIH